MNGGGDMKTKSKRRTWPTPRPIAAAVAMRRPSRAESDRRDAADRRAAAARGQRRALAARPGPAGHRGAAALGRGALLRAEPRHPDPAPSVSPEAVTALGQRLDKLESRLGALEAQAGAGDPAPPDLAPLNARIDAAGKAAEAARARR